MNRGVFTHATSPALTDAPQTSFFRSAASLRHFSLTPQGVHFILLIFLLYRFYRFYRSHVIDKYTRSSLLLKKHKKGVAEATPKELCSVLCIILHFTV